MTIYTYDRNIYHDRSSPSFVYLSTQRISLMIKVRQGISAIGGYAKLRVDLEVLREEAKQLECNDDHLKHN